MPFLLVVDCAERCKLTKSTEQRYRSIKCTAEFWFKHKAVDEFAHVIPVGRVENISLTKNTPFIVSVPYTKHLIFSQNDLILHLI